jgi:hypothetical protein
MNVTMTMDEYQSLLRGVELKSEAQRKSEQELRDLEEKDRERGRKAIAIVDRIEHELEKHGLKLETNRFGSSINIVKKYI